MPIIFPTSPTVGQVFSQGGRSWVWNGSTWDSPSNPDLTTSLATKANLTGGNTFTGTQSLTGSLNNSGRIRAQGITGDPSGVLDLRSLDGVSGFVYKENGGGVVVSSATQTLMTISQAGRVNTPLQPTFFAWDTRGIAIGTGRPAFNTTNVNIGSGYNTSNGLFTAPAAGLYQMNAMMCLRANNTYAELTFLRNGAGIVNRNLALGWPVGASSHLPIHIQAFIQLAASDTVEVRAFFPGAGDYYYGEGLGWFSGTLIG
jgi:hypothetical protein